MWSTVLKDAPLASIYSPELYAAQMEYLVAAADRRKRDSDTAATLLHSARRRLELLGIGANEIEELATRQSVQESLVLRAPREGVIIEQHAVKGESVKTGALLYTIADLSRVWVQAEVFERELSWVFMDQPVRLRPEGSAAELTGRVAFVDPVLDRKTRTARVRIEVDNPAGPGGARLLRIGPRVDAWIDARVDGTGQPAPPGEKSPAAPLAVPRTAVLSTGQRQVIYMLFTERDGRRDYRIDAANLPDAVSYQMVPVRLGPLASEAGTNDAGLYPLLGLDVTDEQRKVLQLDTLGAGMVVVTRGNLLLDSQAQLSGKPSLLFPDGSRGTTDPHAGH
jgi:Cu(I)/Ag(I) efflux system membrane fusion protein